MFFLHKIKKLKKKRHLTNEDLANASGVPIGTLNKILNGNTANPSFLNIALIAKALHCSLDYLTHDQLEMDGNDRQYMQKYISLDSHGKKVVDILLDEELRRVDEIKKEEIMLKKAIRIDALLEENSEDEKETIRQLPLYEYPASAGIGIFAGNGEYEMVHVKKGIPNNINYGVKIKGNSMEPDIPHGSIVWVRQQPDVEIGEVCILIIDDEGYCKRKQKNCFESINKNYPDIIPDESQAVRITGKVVYVQK